MCQGGLNDHNFLLQTKGNIKHCSFIKDAIYQVSKGAMLQHCEWCFISLANTNTELINVSIVGPN